MGYSRYIGKKLRFKGNFFYPKKIKEVSGAVIIYTGNSKKVFTKKEFAKVLANFIKDTNTFTDKQPQWRNRISKKSFSKEKIKNKKVFKEPDGKNSVWCKFDENYIIYRNGDVWSNRFGGRMLKRWAMKSTTGTKHWVVSMGNRKKHQISRLVMFHFGKHNYEKIEDMPKILFVDDDTSNFKLENLKFSNDAEILAKIRRLYPESMRRNKIKDTPVNIGFIVSKLKEGKTLDEIGAYFGVSGMSVHRFKQRNLIK